MRAAGSDTHAKGSPSTSTPVAPTVAPTVLAQAPASRNNSEFRHSKMKHSNQSPTVHCSLLLKLPDPLEMQWLQSDLAVRAYTLSDRMACACSILLNSALFVRVSHVPSSWLGVKGLLAVYISAAVLQLLYMAHNRAAYYKYRLRVIWSHRLVRLLMVVGQVVTYAASDVQKISAELCSSGNNHEICKGITTMDSSVGSGVAGRRRSSSSSSAMGLVAGSGSEMMIGGWQAVVLTARPVVSILLAYAAHANYVLPFRHVLPLQLITFAMSVHLSRGLTCWYDSVPILKHLAMQQCAAMHTFMHMCKLLHTGVEFNWQTSHVCQQGTSAVSVMIVYFNVIMLLWLPCCITYHLEWSSKDIFVRRRHKKLLSRPWPKSVVVIVLVAHTALVASWYSVHYVVGQMALRCRKDGLLTV